MAAWWNTFGAVASMTRHIGILRPPLLLAVALVGVLMPAADVPAQVPVSVVSEPPLVRIGGAEEAREGYFFVRPNGALRLSDGRIVVAACGSDQLRFYGSDGTLLRTVGGPGDGPGEFRMLSRLRRTTADSLMTVDRRQWRVSLFDPRGAFVRSFGIDVGEDVLGRFADGMVLGLTRTGGQRPPGNVVIVRRQAQLFRRAADGSIAGQVGLFPGTAMLFRGHLSTGLSGGLDLALAVAADRMYLGTQDTAHVAVLAPDGTPLGGFATLTAPAPPTEAMRAAVAEAGAAQAPPETRAAFRERLLETPAAKMLPAYGRFLLGADGSLWLQDGYRGNPNPRTRTAYRDGRAAMRAVLPPDFVATDFGHDWVLGISTDSLDIHAIELHRLPAPTAGAVRPPQEPDVQIYGMPRMDCWLRP